MTLKHIRSVAEAGECLYDMQAIDRELARMADEITAALKDQNPLVLCLMTGGIIPTGLLLPKLHFPLQLDYVHATRYGMTTQGGNLEWIHRPKISIKDRVVLLVDDILDAGTTLAAVKAQCESEGAQACYSAVLVDKNIGKTKPVQADFVGVETENRYLYGLGMDYKGYLRNQPGIYACADVQEED